TLTRVPVALTPMSSSASCVLTALLTTGLSRSDSTTRIHHGAGQGGHSRGNQWAPDVMSWRHCAEAKGNRTGSIRAMTIDELISTGTLSIGDRVTFRTHVEVARLFGKNYKGHQQAVIQLTQDTVVWFPKLFRNS